jgi:site-specific DNA recombinase
MSTYFIYARKSTESEDRQALSIGAQTKELTDYARKENLTIAKIFTESKSAKRSGRPVFNAMLKELKHSDVNGILCWKLDRLTRNLADAAIISEALETGIIKEIRTPAQVYRNNSTDKFMSGLDWLVARKYIDDLAENVKRGLRTKVQQGWFPGQAPLGYLNDRNHPQGRRKVVKDPQKFPLVRTVWDMLLSGQYSVPEIMKIADRKLGLKTRKSRYAAGLPLSRSGIYKMFTNPFYCGQFYYKGQLYDGKHEPMVSPEEFDRAQELLGRKGRPRPKKHHFTFTGVIRCGQCGAMVTAEEKFKYIRSTALRKRYVYYHCTHRKDPACRQRSLEETKLKRQVDEFLAKMTIPKDYLDWIFKYLDQVTQAEKTKSAKATESVRAELGKVERRLDNLLALKISPENESGRILSDEEFVQQKNRLMQEKHRLQATLTSETNADGEVIRLTKETFNFATYGRLWFSKGDTERQRTILAGIGSNHTLVDGKLLITAKKPLVTIQSAISNMNSDSGPLEPVKAGLHEQKIRGDLKPSLSWCALVNDVRTEIRKMVAGKVQIVNENNVQ